MIVLNHVYDDPSAMYTNKIKNQGGGKGLQYMGSLNIQCSRCLEKDEDKNSESYYGQSRLHFFTIKNRMVRPSLECDIWLDFKKGFVRQFESLFDEAVRGGFFINTKQGWYSCPTWEDPDKNFRKSYLISGQSAPVWKTFLEAFEEWSNKDLAYKALEQNIDDIEEEINEQIENDSIDEIEASDE
jgi:hypothetical protein